MSIAMSFRRHSIPLMAVGLLASAPAFADYEISCESANNRYNVCELHERGFVTMIRQNSRSTCIKGRSWDWDRARIWVDDGCSAKFRVDTVNHRGFDPRGGDHRGGRDKDDKVDAGVVAGVIIGAAIIGALAYDDDHVRDDPRQGSRQASYVPEWMIGTFTGYNPRRNANVTLRIDNDGQVVAHADGQSVRGYINGYRLNVGEVSFDVDRARDGLVTSQVGRRDNVVRYQRVR